MLKKQNDINILIAYLLENKAAFYRLAYSYTKNAEDAFDIIQNAICKALENFAALREISYLKTWFYRILVNESLNYIKKKKKETCYDFTENQIVWEEKGYDSPQELYALIDSLPEQEQIVIKLRFYEEMSLMEIAEITATNLNTVKARLYRALKKLRKDAKEFVE